MAKYIGKGERRIVYGLAGLTDAIQIALSVFVISEIINHIIDIIVGIAILVYGSIRKIWTTNKILVLLAYFIGEQIPFINALPFWVLDIRNLYSGIPTSMEEYESMNPKNNPDGPFNRIEGIRQSRKPPVLNSSSGIRPPRLPTKI